MMISDVFTQSKILLFPSSRCIICGIRNAKSESVRVLTDQIYMYVGFLPKGPNQKVPLIHYATQICDALFFIYESCLDPNFAVTHIH